jgi:putative transposase
MRQSHFTEEQIIGVLKQAEAGMKTTEICRQHGISSATYYKWKAKYGGLEISEAQRLRPCLNHCSAAPRRLLSERFGEWPQTALWEVAPALSPSV